MSIGTINTNGTSFFYWYSIGEMHLIRRTKNISVGFRLSRGAFYSSIAAIGMIGTNRPLLYNAEKKDFARLTSHPV